MVIEYFREAVSPPPAADAVKLKVPATVGVPESDPLAENNTPGGRVPETDSVELVAKPIAEKPAPYAVPIEPSVSVGGTMSGTGRLDVPPPKSPTWSEALNSML